MTQEEKPSVHALNFEAVKVSMSQNKEGIQLRLAIHPNDCPQSLHTDWVGSRYMVALVKLAHDDTVEHRPSADAGSKAVATAGTICRNPRFQSWLVRMGIASKVSEDDAVDGLKAFLLIESRKELSTDADARKRFNGLLDSFKLDVEAGGA